MEPQPISDAIQKLIDQVREGLDEHGFSASVSSPIPTSPVVRRDDSVNEPVQTTSRLVKASDKSFSFNNDYNIDEQIANLEVSTSYHVPRKVILNREDTLKAPVDVTSTVLKANAEDDVTTNIRQPKFVFKRDDSIKNPVEIRTKVLKVSDRSFSEDVPVQKLAGIAEEVVTDVKVPRVRIKRDDSIKQPTQVTFKLLKASDRSFSGTDSLTEDVSEEVKDVLLPTVEEVGHEDFAQEDVEEELDVPEHVDEKESTPAVQSDDFRKIYNSHEDKIDVSQTENSSKQKEGDEKEDSFSNEDVAQDEGSEPVDTHTPIDQEEKINKVEVSQDQEEPPEEVESTSQNEVETDTKDTRPEEDVAEKMIERTDVLREECEPEESTNEEIAEEVFQKSDVLQDEVKEEPRASEDAEVEQRENSQDAVGIDDKKPNEVHREDVSEDGIVEEKEVDRDRDIVEIVPDNELVGVEKNDSEDHQENISEDVEVIVQLEFQEPESSGIAETALEDVEDNKEMNVSDKSGHERSQVDTTPDDGKDPENLQEKEEDRVDPEHDGGEDAQESLPESSSDGPQDTTVEHTFPLDPEDNDVSFNFILPAKDDSAEDEVMEKKVLNSEGASCHDEERPGLKRADTLVILEVIDTPEGDQGEIFTEDDAIIDLDDREEGVLKIKSRRTTNNTTESDDEMRRHLEQLMCDNLPEVFEQEESDDNESIDVSINLVNDDASLSSESEDLISLSNFKQWNDVDLISLKSLKSLVAEVGIMAETEPEEVVELNISMHNIPEATSLGNIPEMSPQIKQEDFQVSPEALSPKEVFAEALTVYDGVKHPEDTLPETYGEQKIVQTEKPADPELVDAASSEIDVIDDSTSDDSQAKRDWIVDDGREAHEVDDAYKEVPSEIPMKQADGHTDGDEKDSLSEVDASHGDEFDVLQKEVSNNQEGEEETEEDVFSNIDVTPEEATEPVDILTDKEEEFNSVEDQKEVGPSSEDEPGMDKRVEDVTDERLQKMEVSGDEEESKEIPKEDVVEEVFQKFDVSHDEAGILDNFTQNNPPQKDDVIEASTTLANVESSTIIVPDDVLGFAESLTQEVMEEVTNSFTHETPILEDKERTPVFRPITPTEAFGTTSVDDDLDCQPIRKLSAVETLQKVLHTIPAPEDEFQFETGEVVEEDMFPDSLSESLKAHDEDDEEGLDSIGEISEIQKFQQSFDSDLTRRDSFSSISSFGTRQQFRTAIENIRSGLLPFASSASQYIEPESTLLTMASQDIPQDTPPADANLQFFGTDAESPRKEPSEHSSVDSSGFEKVDDDDILAEYSNQFARQMQQSMYGGLPEDVEDDFVLISDSIKIPSTSNPSSVRYSHLRKKLMASQHHDDIQENDYFNTAKILDSPISEEARKLVQDAVESASDYATSAKESAGHVVDDIAAELDRDVHAAGDFLSQKAHDAKNAFEDAGHYVSEKAHEAKDALGDAGHAVADFITEKGHDAQDSLDDFANTASNKASGAVDDLVDFGDDLADKVPDISHKAEDVHNEIDQFLSQAHREPSPIEQQVPMTRSLGDFEEEPDFGRQTPESEETTFDRKGPLTIPEMPEREEEEEQQKTLPDLTDFEAVKPYEVGSGAHHHGFETVPRPPTPPKDISDEDMKPSLVNLGPSPSHARHDPHHSILKHRGEPWFDFKTIDPRVLDLIYWRDTKKSAVALSLILISFFVLTKYPILSVIAYTGLAVLAATLGFRIFKLVEAQIKKTGGENPFQSLLAEEVSVPQEKVHAQVDVLVEHGTYLANQLKRLVLVESICDSVKFGLLLWSLTYIASWFSGFTIVFLAILGVFSIPKLYETYQEPIDTQLAALQAQIQNVQNIVEEKLPFLRRPVAVEEEKKDQ